MAPLICRYGKRHTGPYYGHTSHVNAEGTETITVVCGATLDRSWFPNPLASGIPHD